MTCQDCFHYKVCNSFGFVLDPLRGGVICCDFKNKADVVEVVRCKDCKHFMTDTFKRTMCNRTFTMFEMNENDFCSYGERKGAN